MYSYTHFLKKNDNHIFFNDSVALFCCPAHSTAILFTITFLKIFPVEFPYEENIELDENFKKKPSNGDKKEITCVRREGTQQCVFAKAKEIQATT